MPWQEAWPCRWPRRNFTTNEWLGADFGSLIPLSIETRANYPIDFSTANLFRARINERTSYPIGAAPTDARNGYMLLSGRSDYLHYKNGPFTRLHLVDDEGVDDPIVFAQDIGFRNWMRNGITFTGNSDQAYIGQKYKGDDNTDFVIQWSDNENGSPWGVDRMKFIFSSKYTATSRGMGSDYGLEAMRFWPHSSKDVNVGVGDFFAANQVDPLITDPTERLDMVDGRLRIRELPNSTATTLPYRVMVVDDSPYPSPERGVVKWATLPTSPGGDCDWIIQPGTNHVCNTYNGSACPWNADNFVGIGTQSPKAKLQIYADNTSPYTSGVVTYSQLWTNTVGGQSIWGEARTPLSTQFLNSTLTGVRGSAENARYSWGVSGTAEINASSPSTAVDLKGVQGIALGNGNALRAIGVYGTASGATNITDTWAAWFDGRGYLSSGPWQPSDVNLKQDVEDLSPTEMATALMQLHPKSYAFNTSTYPYMHLPTEPQRG